MGSIPPELSLDFRPLTTKNAVTTAAEQRCCYVPKTIKEFVGEVSMMGCNVQEKLLKLDDYVKNLEDEMRKIDAFKRELPLCMLLLNDAIGTLKEESTRYKKSNGEPVLEEFIPLKKTCDEDAKQMVAETRKDKDCRDKMSWMSSVQLWNSDNPSSKTDFDDVNSGQNSKPESKKIVMEEEIKDDLFKSCKNGSIARAFLPFQGSCGTPLMMTKKEGGYEIAGVPGLSLHIPGRSKAREDIGSLGLNSKIGGSKALSCSVSNVQSNVRAAMSQQQQQTSRKQRRCWSPELHRRFIDALQKLGGCQAATPKQIRELMQVDGLTNDEVKSHLQKYRLHTRRLPTTTGTSKNQPVGVLGSLWISQDQHGESSKQSSSQSGSPQGPLQLGGASGGTSMTGGDSMEDEEDEKSESHSWKGPILTSQITDV